MKNLNTFAPVLFLVMWSSGAVIVKLGLQFASEWSFLTLRAALSFACISMMYLIAKRLYPNGFTQVRRQDFKSILAVGLMLQVLYLAFYILAIGSGISPGLVTLVLGLQPLITPLLCKQRLTATQIILLMVGFAGLAIAISGSQSIQHIAATGFGFALCALLAITGGTIWQANIRVHSVQAMFYQSGLATLSFSGLTLLTGWQVDWTGEFVFAWLWMSLVVSVGALLLLMYMVKQDSADKVSVLFYAIPVLTYLFDYLLFDEPLTLTTLLGMVIVASAVILYRKYTHARPANFANDAA
ncbi:DMT family transporter [Vibrio sp. SCSIO 43135]|uniref:DMT family transporter n=1 Tax=Vibrio sp. SCSIO 43135 TaxID=2819096 RepID=UPI002074DA88|nr:DMT family transporter [Vibrio sp. SCSIO 43135]USD40615.1 DMT family transporter [Vibrio sp. SCSIO 43135]